FVQLMSSPAHAPAIAPAGDAAYVSFSVALRQAYAEFARAEGETLGGDFDRAPLDRKLKALEERVWPQPEHPAALGLDGPTGLAIDEARPRLRRLYGLGAREAHPRESATAQTALDCWALRAALRRDGAATDECENRFFATVIALEDGLLPLKTQDPFHRRL